MKKVLVFGTFDGIHKGHLNFLKQSRRNGDYVTAVVTRDANVRKAKGRLPIFNENERLAGIRKHVDKAILGEKRITYGLIKILKPDVICIGYDQRPTMAEAQAILRKIGMEKVRLKKMRPYKTKVYKSSILNKSR